MLQVKGSELEQLTERILCNVENLSKIISKAVSYNEGNSFTTIKFEYM